MYGGFGHARLLFEKLLDLAEFLVAKGMPFRDAHALVGQLVRRHLAGEGTLRALAEADPSLGPDAAALVAPGVAVQRRTTSGGAGPAAVAAQMTRFRGKVSDLREAIAKYVR